MSGELSRQIEAELGALLDQGAAAGRGEPAAFRPVRPPSAAKPRRRLRWASLGAYATTAQVGIAAGSALSVIINPRGPTASVASAPRPAAAPPPAPLQLMSAVAPTPPTPAAATPTAAAIAPATARSAAVLRARAPAAARAAPAGETGRRPSGGVPALRRLAAVPARVAASAPSAAEPAAPLDERGRALQLAGATWCGALSSHCLEEDIAGAAQQLAAAYAQARRAGVPARELRLDREDWRAERAYAARISEVALLDAYQARARRVRAMAEDWRELASEDRAAPDWRDAEPLDVAQPRRRTDSRY